MIRSFKNLVDLALKPCNVSIKTYKFINQSQYGYSQNPKKSAQEEDDDENVSFADLLKQGEDKLQKQKTQEEKQQEFQQKYNNFDPREIYLKTIKVQEKTLNDDEIKKHTKETFQYTNQENPFFNPEAANIHKIISGDDEIIREWQYQFQKQHKRKPSLREMQEDYRIGQILASREAKRKMLTASVFKYKID